MNLLASAKWKTVSWRSGTKGRLKARFAAVRVRTADGPRRARTKLTAFWWFYCRLPARQRSTTAACYFDGHHVYSKCALGWGSFMKWVLTSVLSILVLAADVQVSGDMEIDEFVALNPVYLVQQAGEALPT